MALTEELGLRRPLKAPAHEALLNIYYTSSQMKKRADEFFAGYGITSVQFNLMELLLRQADEDEGLTQAELSQMMLVNRANITSLIDRMEKADLVVRTPVPGDRRYNAIKLTEHGRKVLLEVEERYLAAVAMVMSPLSKEEQDQLMSMLERLRENLP
jgi:DNA-binding MarR family transcriptional regulator